MKNKTVIYYDANGKIDKFATCINNHDWVIPVWFIISFILAGIVEGL